MDLQDFEYWAPEGFLIKEAWFYTYEDSMYHSLGVSSRNKEGCMPAFTFEPGGPNIPVGGERCVTFINPDLNVYGDYGYVFRNTSDWDVDVFMFKLVENPKYCEFCIGGSYGEIQE